MKTGIANFPLDYGACPRWLFERMTRLSRSIIQAIVSEFGAEEFLKRLSDPVWFQSFGCVLAFDWNSSGLGTTTCGAIKAGIYGLEKDLGLFVCGGKGKTSRKTPEEIEKYGEVLGLSQEKINNLIYASKMTAKVDSSLIQNSQAPFQLYHHNFIFTRSSQWVVIQQAMAPTIQKARRYHWLSSKIYDFTEEPHAGISSSIKVKPLNLTAKESKENKEISTELVRDGYKTLLKDLKLIREKELRQPSLFRCGTYDVPHRARDIGCQKILEMPGDDVLPQLSGDLNFSKSKYLDKILYQLHEQQPENFEQLLMTRGVGPMTVRALSLVSELIYGAKPSYEDPARYSFAFGGKDSIPFPVNRPVYDKTLDIIEKGIKKSPISNKEKLSALQRYKKVYET